MPSKHTELSKKDVVKCLFKEMDQDDSDSMVSLPPSLRFNCDHFEVVGSLTTRIRPIRRIPTGTDKTQRRRKKQYLDKERVVASCYY